MHTYYQLAQEDIPHLCQTGLGRLGTCESCFNMILAISIFPQLKTTVEAYSRMANQDLLSSVGHELKSSLKTVLQCTLNCLGFLLKDCYSMKCTNTDVSTLIRIVVTGEINLVQIKQMFS